MTFYGRPFEVLAWWGLPFLAFAIFAGNRALSDTLVGLGILGFPMTLAAAWFGRMPRIIVLDGFLIERIGFKERRWRWSDIRSIQLDHAERSGRPTINFRVSGEGRVFLWGPWNVDEVTLYTAMTLAHAHWGQARSPAQPASAVEA
jgi:hypothetical protein